MYEMAEETRLPVDIDAQPLVAGGGCGAACAAQIS